MKPVFTSAVMLSDFIRAQAGNPEARFDIIVSAVYTAYRHILKSGNRTQFNKVETDVAKYADVKACKELVNAERITPAVKQAHAVYLAYGAALAQVGVPALMKGADSDALDDAASVLATEFATSVTIALTPEAKAVKSEEEKAAAKAEKEQAKAQAQAQAEAEQAELIRAEAERIAQATVLTLADMVRIVANAVKTGQLESDDIQTLDAALDSVATGVTLQVVETEAEPLAA